MRLIDADILLGYVNKYDTGQPIGKALRAMLEKSTTVDAVPVIRCKDCKWWKAEKEECYEWYDSPYAPANGYCFRAERKEE